MVASLLSPSRCVLLVGDEALSVYNVTSRAARFVESVPWQADEFDEVVAGLIRKECSGRSVLILNDMTDQHFKGGQRLPNVGFMDKANVLQRKLMVAFPNYPIRGALQLKVPPQEQEALGGKQGPGIYLFAAVPMSQPILKTMEAVKRSLSSISGFFLLPVEASDMVRVLSEKLAGKGKEPARWVVFIGQHHSGALRQVITRDGQLAMTRMTPVIDTDTDHDAWAKEVFQEFKATISYLSRFGFTSDESTEVIVVCHPQAGQALEGLIDIPCRYTAFTAPEAARELNITIGSQENSRYADPLHVAWAGRKTRFILPMKTPEISRLSSLRQSVAIAMLLLICAAGYFGWQVSSQMGTMSSTRSQIANQHMALDTAQQEYDAALGQMQAAGFDVKLIQGTIGVFKTLEARRVNTLALLKQIDQALGDDLRLDALTVTYVPTEAEKAGDSATAYDPTTPPPAEASKPEVEANLKLSFPPTIEVEMGVKEVNDLRQRLATLLPQYTVTVEKNVAGLEYSDTFTGEVGATPAKTPTDQDYVAEIKIRGVVQGAQEGAAQPAAPQTGAPAAGSSETGAAQPAPSDAPWEAGIPQEGAAQAQTQAGTVPQTTQGAVQ